MITDKRSRLSALSEVAKSSDKNHCQLRFLSMINHGMIVHARPITKMRLNATIPSYLAMQKTFIFYICNTFITNSSDNNAVFTIRVPKFEDNIR